MSLHGQKMQPQTRPESQFSTGTTLAASRQGLLSVFDRRRGQLPELMSSPHLDFKEQADCTQAWDSRTTTISQNVEFSPSRYGKVNANGGLRRDKPPALLQIRQSRPDAEVRCAQLHRRRAGCPRKKRIPRDGRAWDATQSC